MTSSTKRLAMIAPICALLSAGVCFGVAYQVNSAGDELRVQNLALAESQAKEETFFRLQRTLQESTNDRATLAAHFFASESDGINFLNTIEALGRTFGVPITTEQIEPVTDKETNQSAVRTRFSFSGSKESVLQIAQLFEVLPYKSTVSSLTLKSSGSDLWEGNIELLITIAQYD